MGPVLDLTTVARPVVSWAYMTTALMPMPCWPRLCRMAWNREPYSRRPNTLAICLRTIPGPLSSTTRR